MVQFVHCINRQIRNIQQNRDSKIHKKIKQKFRQSPTIIKGNNNKANNKKKILRRKCSNEDV